MMIFMGTVVERNMKRRDFLKNCLFTLGGASLLHSSLAKAGINMSNNIMKVRAGRKRPNVILCMCDDMGWGDAGYHGTNSEIKTPHLNNMAKQSLQFSRWYAGAPVCSPTRGSSITGRHPFRYGITYANVGRMKPQEITLSEAVKPLGYRTGHFGKWHMGTLTTTINDSNRGGPGSGGVYSPPWENGFDVCYSTEAKVPTWDPMYKVGTSTFYGARYWTAEDAFVPIDSQELRGDDSRVMMDQAIPFIRDSASKNKPFFAVIWFHTPHKPVVAGPEYKAMYSQYSSDKQNYYGCITAMDEQMGRLRKELRNLGIADNTMLWFSSDNGPENGTPGTTGGFRARKRSLYEGGVRVPGLLEWPAMIEKHRITNLPCSSSDHFPTVMDVLGYQMKGQPEPVDGVSLLPLIKGEMTQRPVPIGFQSDRQRSLTDNRYKLYSSDRGSTYELYDLIDDPYETDNIAGANPSIANSMKTTLETWIASCANSNAGDDYI